MSMPAITRTVATVGDVTVTGQGPYSRFQTGGLNGAMGLVGYDDAEAVITVAPETANRVYADNANALAFVDAIIADFNTVFPANTVLPAITGTTTSGQTLTTTNGTWTGTPGPTYARKWYADGVEIAGQTALTLVLGAPQVGKRITVVVTATNANGVVTATSAQTAIIA